jgi:hypothetical protein
MIDAYVRIDKLNEELKKNEETHKIKGTLDVYSIFFVIKT